MGGLYTQHYISNKDSSKSGLVGGGKTFEVVYEGELASITNTRPLFAALIKGLTASISDSGGRDVNIVNASLIAKEKGIIINESHNRESSELAYASLITLKATGSEAKNGPSISGYVSGKTGQISRLGRFATSFVPEGTLLICHNYDEPGKIGGVGNVLGKKNVNIRFMTVASLEHDEGVVQDQENEALMILGVEGVIDADLLKQLRAEKGILDVSVVQL